MQVFLCTVVEVNYRSNSTLEAGIADEHSHVLPVKRLHHKLCSQYRKFSSVCAAAEVNLLKNSTVLITLKSKSLSSNLHLGYRLQLIFIL